MTNYMVIVTSLPSDRFGKITKQKIMKKKKKMV